jgi:GDP-4-dehydro-6-deoxy-D-mannose reductase
VKRNKSRVLITGIAGFAGSYLTELLLGRGYRIFGLLAPGEKTENIGHLKKDITLERFDITKRDRVSRFIKSVKPQYIFHLAAFSSVGRSFANERQTYDINFTGSLNLFEAATDIKKHLKKLIFVSSADIYGNFTPVGKRLDENQLINPISPYGISKAAAEYLCRYYVRQYNLPAVIARPFNHTGPRQSETFVIPSFCRQIARIEHGLQKPQMTVGDLSARRDLSDVRDIVRGYSQIARKAKPGEIYHLCSGKTVAIKTALDKLLKLADVTINVRTDKSRFRKLDIPILKGDNSRIQKSLGWRPTYNLERTLADTLEFWRNK